MTFNAAHTAFRSSWRHALQLGDASQLEGLGRDAASFDSMMATFAAGGTWQKARTAVTVYAFWSLLAAREVLSLYVCMVDSAVAWEHLTSQNFSSALLLLCMA